MLLSILFFKASLTYRERVIYEHWRKHTFSWIVKQGLFLSSKSLKFNSKQVPQLDGDLLFGVLSTRFVVNYSHIKKTVDIYNICNLILMILHWNI